MVEVRGGDGNGEAPDKDGAECLRGGDDESSRAPSHEGTGRCVICDGVVIGDRAENLC